MPKSIGSGGRRAGAARPPSNPERRAEYEAAKRERRGRTLSDRDSKNETPGENSPPPTPAHLLALAQDAANLMGRLIAAALH